MDDDDLIASVEAFRVRRSVASKGGRPTDRELVIAEAKRRIARNENLPPTLTTFVDQLRAWLAKHPRAHRNKKTNVVMRAKTIRRHVTNLWPRPPK
jgi:hypothetical protein